MRFDFKPGSTLRLKRQILRWALMCLCLPAFSLPAQQGPPGFDLEDLPESRHLVAALSDRASRTDTLLTMIAVERLLEYSVFADWGQLEDLEARFREERTWLDHLTTRYLDLPIRGSVLDPAAWFVLFELGRHQLSPGPDISPLGPDSPGLMRQLFDRSDERLSAAILPELMQRMEPRAVSMWSVLREAAASDEVLNELVLDLNTDWFDPWIAAEPPAPSGGGGADTVIDEALDSLVSLATSAMTAGPPDALRLKRLRYSLLAQLPALDEVRARDAAYLLRLAGSLDGLEERRYLAFTETLLWVVSDLLLSPATLAAGPDPVAAPLDAAAVQPASAADGDNPPTSGKDMEGVPVEPVQEEFAAGLVEPAPVVRSQVPRVLSEMLPALSNAFAAEFSEVDPRINAILAAVFDVVQFLQAGLVEVDRLAALRRETGNAVAQMVLLIPDMDYYFDQPVRQQISTEIDICATSVAGTGQPGETIISREDFNDCLQSLVELADTIVREEELAGDPGGPFGSEQLRREMQMAPWQRINYSLGYLHERFPSACELPAQPLPNPLEWASLATTVAWFARQSPIYFHSPENEALILRMRELGSNLLQDLLEQVDCVSGEGSGINDPVLRSLVDYRLALDDLVAGLREAELELRAERLASGADVVLHGDASQSTAYRPEDLTIAPCRPDRICEMSDEIEATRALMGLFPDTYLIADQTGLGRIEICYDNLQWVDRRAEPVRQDDPHVANYHGKLSFDLIGRYHEKGDVTNVFGSNFVSPEEYHYLFAPATDEVLEDSCPVEWVGSRIVTGLKKQGSVRVVPDRLTYLASARSKPSQVIKANWSRGAEWRDWFVTGLGITPFEFESDPGIGDRINQHLHFLYQAEQSALYNALLRSQSRSGRGEQDSLFVQQEELTARKSLLRAYINLFYPQILIDSDEIRASLEGYGAVLDTEVLRRFREENAPVASINESGISRMEEFQSGWVRLPDAVRRSGSIATSLVHAITRLNDLYIEFFAVPAISGADEDVKPAAGPRG